LRATPSYRNLTTTSLQVFTCFSVADPPICKGFGGLQPVPLISSGCRQCSKALTEAGVSLQTHFSFPLLTTSFWGFTTHYRLLLVGGAVVGNGVLNKGWFGLNWSLLQIKMQVFGKRY